MHMAVSRRGYGTGDTLASPRYLAYLCALAALVFALYAPTLGYPYVYEDRLNPPVQWRGIETEVREFQFLHPARYVSNLSYRATHALSLDPWADHLGNVAIHTLNTGLLVAALFPVFGSMALWMGALFGFHPLQSEAVAYISARPDLLVATGILLALCGVSYGRVKLLVFGLLIAALSKETGVMAAPLAVFWSLWSQQPIKSWALWLLGAGALVLGLGHLVQFPLIASNLEIGQHCAMFWRLLALIVPVGLTIDHDWIWITPLLAGLAFVSWIVVAHLALYEYPQSWLGFGLVFALLAILPRLCLHDPEPIHEHHMYAPMIGLSIGLPMLAQSVSAWLAQKRHGLLIA